MTTYETTGTAPRAFRVIGTTDDVTDCALCGRDDLKHTIALMTLDTDGTDTGDVVYYGSDCGARATGWTQRDLDRAARTADRAATAAREAADRAAQAAESHTNALAFYTWLSDTYGTLNDDAVAAAHFAGSPFRLRKHYTATTGRRPATRTAAAVRDLMRSAR